MPKNKLGKYICCYYSKYKQMNKLWDKGSKKLVEEMNIIKILK